jgi:dihydrolipoamide dehydrogenase
MDHTDQVKRYDLIVVGSGAGNIVADAALAAGRTVALVERKNWGGTCLNHGCIPTKILATPADILQEAGAYAKIGLKGELPKADWQTMVRRVNDIIHSYRKGVETYYGGFENCTLYHGTARFVTEKELSITSASGTVEYITADRIVLAIGGTSNIPPVPGLNEAGFLTAESFFAKMPETLYKDIVFVGGADIGVEFCHILSTFGCQVTLVQRNVRLVPKQDAEVSAQLLKQFKAAGINVLLNQTTVSVRTEGGRKFMLVRDKSTGEERTVSGEELFISAGITPNTRDLGLENTAISTDERGWIRTNEYLETTAPGIYALGDINGLMKLRHKANYEAEILGFNLFQRRADEAPRFARYDVMPSATFSYPQIGRCGLTEQEALDKGYKIRSGKHPFSAVIKAYAMGIDAGDVEDGFVKLVVEQGSNRILGIHCCGPQSSILVQGVAWLMNAGKQPSAVRNPDIETELSKKWRPTQHEQVIQPNTLHALTHGCTIHPALSEVVGWAPGSLTDIN